MTARSETTSRSPAAPPGPAYIDELLPDVLDRAIEPGKVFDQTVDLEGAPGGYRAVAERKALKVMIDRASAKEERQLACRAGSPGTRVRSGGGRKRELFSGAAAASLRCSRRRRQVEPRRS